MYTAVPESPADILRPAVVAWVKKHGRGSQKRLALEVAKVDTGTFSAYKKGRHGLGLAECRRVADFIGFPASELFVIPVRENPTLTGRVTPAASDGTSNRTLGDVPNAVEAGLLRARNLELEEENAALRIALRAGADKLKELSTELAKSARQTRGGVRRPAQRKPVAG